MTSYWSSYLILPNESWCRERLVIRLLVKILLAEPDANISLLKLQAIPTHDASCELSVLIKKLFSSNFTASPDVILVEPVAKYLWVPVKVNLGRPLWDKIPFDT